MKFDVALILNIPFIFTQLINWGNINASKGENGQVYLFRIISKILRTPPEWTATFKKEQRCGSNRVDREKKLNGRMNVSW